MTQIQFIIPALKNKTPALAGAPSITLLGLKKEIMVKANELMVGNLIAMPIDSGKPYWKVLEIRENGIIYGIDWKSGTAFCKLDIPDPIPLSPEWLGKFEFVKDRNGWRLPNTQFSLTDNLFPCWLDRMLWPGGLPDFNHVQLKHVHQLQNLYFWLSGGEELSITSPSP